MNAICAPLHLRPTWILPAVVALTACTSMADVTPSAGQCASVRHHLPLEGSALTQARCLLRTVQPWGRIDPEAADLPDSLSRLIAQPMAPWRTPMQKLVVASKLTAPDLGGPLDAPVSVTAAGAEPALTARYFVIHDTSWPWMGTQAFPADDNAQLNDLSTYAHASTAMAHVFVNRVGQAYTAHGFDEPWRATKLETRVMGPAAKGLLLHVELVQARRQAPDGPRGNDAQAPMPGFTQAQYDRLALLYMAASLRAGAGLVPALHGALDEGLEGAHDDPQNFKLAEFGAALARLQSRLVALR